MTSFPRRCGSARPLPVARGIAPGSPYTPAMRRWVCIVALLAGFGGSGYAWSARPRAAVPIERSLERMRDGDRSALPTTAGWWIRA